MEAEHPLIKEAYHFARMKHRGKKHPFSHRPQFDHVVKVYFQVYRFTKDVDIRVAALLHDTLRYSRCSYDEIARRFSITIADWVKEISWKEENNEDDGFHGKDIRDIMIAPSFESRQAEREKFFKSLLLKGSRESAMILLADRLEETNYLENLEPEKRKQYLLENDWLIASLPQPWNTEHGFLIEELRKKKQEINTLE